MKLTYGNCHRSVLEALMNNGHTQDEAMAIWNASKLNRFESDGTVVSESATDGCDSGLAMCATAGVATEEQTRLWQAELRVRELERILADKQLEIEQLQQRHNEQSRDAQNRFREIFDEERKGREESSKSTQARLDSQHNRIITLESSLRTVRKLTHDPEILPVTRLALTDRGESLSR